MLVLRSFSYLLAVLTFIPLVKDSYWIFRTLEYPRFQKLLINLTLLLAWALVFLFGAAVDWICVALLLTSTIYLCVKIFPYTALSPKEVITIKTADPDNSVRLFTANVYQYQRNFGALLGQIEDTDPDVIVLVETDKQWQQGVSALESGYAYRLAEPLDNTYGILLFSRFRLLDARIVYLVKNDIPSFEAKVELPSGIQVQLYGLHPEPPVPGESLRSTAKDKELMKVAFKAKDCPMPCIVLGDLNDVAWSYTTSLFTKVSRLLDVRCGRGFYSTFSAKSLFVRFPLDYVFCSSHFGLYAMKRLSKNGSDHFPIFTHLVYSEHLSRQPGRKKADAQEMREAREMKEKSSVE